MRNGAKEETIKNTSETQFRTEFECEFLFYRYTYQCICYEFYHIIHLYNKEGILAFMKKLKQDHHYVVTVDWNFDRFPR